MFFIDLLVEYTCRICYLLRLIWIKKIDVIEDSSSIKMFLLFEAVEVLMKRTFFVFSPFLFLLIGSQGFSVFFLKLLKV